MLSAGPVHETGLYACVGLDHGRSSVLVCRRWLDVVLAVHPQSLHDLKCVLLMLVRVGVSSLKERR